jgi:hypothetical protein
MNKSLDISTKSAFILLFGSRKEEMEEGRRG